jgi:copper chaperone CopZ
MQKKDIRRLVVAVFVLVGLVPTTAQQKSSTIKTCSLTVAGMTCAGCEAAVRNAAKTVNGVTDVKASYDKKSAEVTYDSTKTSPEAIAKVITERSGFTATVPSEKRK